MTTATNRAIIAGGLGQRVLGASLMIAGDDGR